MEWQKIDPQALPLGEVLAANFEPRTYGYKEKLVGYLSLNRQHGYVSCIQDGVELTSCTHYIDIHKFDIK